MEIHALKLTISEIREELEQAKNEKEVAGSKNRGKIPTTKSIN
jgi:hypothetical protein